MPKPPDVFSVNSASLYAKAHGYSPSERASLRIAIATGELPARRLAGGSWIIEPADLLAFFRARKCAPPATREEVMA